MKKKFYIKQRYNVQLGEYFVPCGQMTKTEAKKHERPVYGDNIMIPYETEAEYNAAISKLKRSGEKVH
jgi:hypothetical protein